MFYAPIGQAFYELTVNPYYQAVLPLTLLTATLAWFTRPRTSEPFPQGFVAFKWKFLSVWYIAAAVDWLQGPHVYALYESYGFNEDQIAALFVAGFGSSLLFGTCIGMVADVWGRKRCCILYCLLYAASCLTKHVDSFWVLMVGRILAGIATSIIFSAFESWMVADFSKHREFPQSLLTYMFAMMYFGNYCVAIIAGFAAEIAARITTPSKLEFFSHVYTGGFIAPFDMAMLVGLSCTLLISLSWTENYGEAKGRNSLWHCCTETVWLIRSNVGIMLLGLVSSTFEGCMYTFIFNWTPALAVPDLPPLPHGLVFSLFMMCCMCGAAVFSLADPQVRPSAVLFPTLVLSASALLTASICIQLKTASVVVFVAFLVYEFTIGIYFPAMGTMKSHVVPEPMRASVYSFFRVPMNMILCSMLLSRFKLDESFRTCCLLLISAVVALGLLMFIIEKDKSETADDGERHGNVENRETQPLVGKGNNQQSKTY